MNIRNSFEHVGFTPEEKVDLTARLKQAAEQEETMTDATKRKIKRISGGMIFGVAAAVMMTAGALAATLSPGVVRTWLSVSVPNPSQTPDSSICQPDQSGDISLVPPPVKTAPPAKPVVKPVEEPPQEVQAPEKPSGRLGTWFNTSTATAPEALENNTCVLNRSETCNGWTVTLDECAGDSSSVYIHVTVAAPEGAVLDESCFYGIYQMESDTGNYDGGNMYHIPDEDPTDNRIAFLILSDFNYKDVKGSKARVEISELLNYWWEREDAGLTEEEAVFYAWLTELAAPIRDHVWTFEDVVLDFPEQTVRMESSVQVPYLNGTTTVTRLEASPFNVTLRVEGGSIAALADYSYYPVWEDPETFTLGDVTITEGVTVQNGEKRGLSREELLDALTVEVVLRDGTALPPLTIPSAEILGRTEGIEGPETPFVEITLRCAEISYLPSQIWDPAQVDHVAVCGVDIPVSPAPAED